MSSRAIRRAQQEREKLNTQSEPKVANESSSEEDTPYAPKKGPSAFELLQQQQEDAEQSGEAVDEIEQNECDDVEENKPSQLQPGSKSKRKRKKKRKVKDVEGNEVQRQQREMDEIDVALRELSTSGKGSKDARPAGESQELSESDQGTFDVLAVDLSHLHVRNEMRRLFGDISFNDNSSENSRRGGQVDEHVGLAEAVKGVNSASGAGLPSVIRRRNIFIQGKEEWPKASGGGLSMEIERTESDGTTWFKFVHNETYLHAQSSFASCVESMDPILMVNLLRFNPYHISTLLQVSEIAKHEQDHATAGDLLERALFSFGRALHPKFSTAITQGKARLDFRYFQNREFYLAACRYIRNVSMRATWRTAFEWARLLYQMNPKLDPYGVLYMIDQLALRARQSELFLRFCEFSSSDKKADPRSSMPNLKFCQALAEHMMHSPSAELKLTEAIASYPWLAARLFQELDVAPIPPSVWGQTPPDDMATLQTELYVKQASDLWKTPQAIALLKSAARELDKDALTPDRENAIGLREARYVLLLEQPELIKLLPSEFTSMLTLAYDPLPPEDSPMR